jgi:hypothetical protein
MITIIIFIHLTMIPFKSIDIDQYLLSGKIYFYEGDARRCSANACRVANQSVYGAGFVGVSK